MRTAYICETPFHLFQCVRYACNIRNSTDVADLYLNEKADAGLEKRFAPERTGIFENVVRFDQEAVKVSYAESIISGLTDKYVKRNEYNTLKKKIAYAHFVKRAILMTGSRVPADRLLSYDRILAPAGTGLTISLSVINPQAEIVYYEDGIGGYYGDMFIFGRYADSLRSKLEKCGIDPEDLRPGEILVSDPSHCRSKTAKKISKMECGDPSSAEIRQALHRVFGDDNADIYLKNRIVYFSPLTVGDHEDYKIVATRNKKLCEDIDSVGMSFVVRPHPKEENDLPDIKNGTVEKDCVQWEMIAMEQISDEHILIGGCSTAQLTPKLLFDREPYVIFTYDELFGGTGIEKKEIADVINILFELYRDKSKVTILKKGEDIAEVLRRIAG